MIHIWSLKNHENQSVTRAIKNAYFKNSNPCVSKLNFCSYSSNMTSRQK